MPSLETRLRSLSPYSRRAEHSRRDDRSLSRSPSPRRRRYSRSPSPPSRHQRSRSPRRDHKEPKRKNTAGGFRWKEKPRNEEEDRRDDGRLERGYREQDKPRARSATRDGGKRDDIESKFGPHKVVSRDSGKGNDVEDKFSGEKPKKEKEKKVKPAVAPVGQEMIIVNVNDRLGTKASIPCLASDPIKLFKAQVAARIGRQPHEIMLKRQGERPFKDQLTLEDYGVSNGVQLDLEIDTGD